MPGYVVAAVLLAALLHASWNALVKSGRDTFLTTVLVAAGAGLVSCLALPFADAPLAASWPYIAASVAVQLIYFELLIATYLSGDMSHAYPIMRGTAPLIVTVAGWLLLGEQLLPTQWLAVLCICGAILGLGAFDHADRRDVRGRPRPPGDPRGRRGRLCDVDVHPVRRSSHCKDDAAAAWPIAPLCQG